MFSTNNVNWWDPLPIVILDLKSPLGSNSNPIRCNGIKATKRYLKSLIEIKTKKRIKYKRLGSSFGPYGSMIDLYEIKSKNKKDYFYIDMYHQNYKEISAPNGYILK